MLKFTLFTALLIILPYSNASEKFNKKTFGHYKRTQVMDTTSMPFSAVGEIGQHCTGTLIGPSFVLTAAHCVVDFTYRHTRKTFAPGRNGELNPLGIHNWKKVIVPREYLFYEDDNFDFALIILKNNLGDGYGIIPITSNPSELEGEVQANIIGYPGDKPLGTMWEVGCKVSIQNRETLYHLCDTYEGMSGGAIFTYDRKTKERSVIGIHTFGNPNHNGGVFINKEIKSRLEKWMANSNTP